MPQSLTHIIIHLIFSTKDRKPFIKNDIREELHAYMVGIFREYKCHPIIVSSALDHVHVLFILARDQDTSKVVGRVKSGSSKWIKTKGPQYEFFQWQRGYSAFSVSQSNAKSVKDYIERQQEHHRKVSFMDE